MASVAIVGVGAVGGVLAGLLHGQDLTLCTRRPRAELRVETPAGIVRVSARNLTDAAESEPVDWVLVATKTYDGDGAKLWLRHLCGPRTQVAVVQNGVEHRENFAPEFNVLPVVIDVPAERRADGSVLQRGACTMKVEDSAAGQEFAALFADTAAMVEVTPDFLSAAWGKLCINAAGVISALTLRPAGVLRDAECGELALGIIGECLAVARAEGAKLPDDLAQTILNNYRKGSPDSINSLLADRLAGRRTEVEARNGVIVRRGARHGIATPLNRMAVTIVRAQSAADAV